MRELFSFVFDLATDPLGLPISALWEYVILAVINFLAYKIAWEVSPGGFGGSAIHWSVRLIVFVAIWAVTYAIISAVKFIIAHWVIFVCGVVTLAAICVAVAYWWNHRGRYPAA